MTKKMYQAVVKPHKNAKKFIENPIERLSGLSGKSVIPTAFPK